MCLLDIQEDFEEDCLPHGRKLLEQLGLGGSGIYPPSRPKPVDCTLKVDRCREPSVEKAFYRFPEDLDESNPPEVPLPFWN